MEQKKIDGEGISLIIDSLDKFLNHHPVVGTLVIIILLLVTIWLTYLGFSKVYNAIISEEKQNKTSQAVENIDENVTKLLSAFTELTEVINDKIKTLNSQIKGLENNLKNEIKNIPDNISSQLKQIDISIESINKIINIISESLSKKLDMVDKNVSRAHEVATRLEDTITSMKSKLNEMHDDINSIKKLVVASDIKIDDRDRKIR